MSALTLRLPDGVADRLGNVARSRGVSVNELATKLSVQSLAVYDAGTCFEAGAAAAIVPETLAAPGCPDAQNPETD
jgi:hypothetical protein